MLWDRKVLVDYKVTFNSVTGKRVLADLAKSCYYTQPIFSEDPIVMAHREGSRDVFLKILTTLKLDPNEIENILQEEEDDIVD